MNGEKSYLNTSKDTLTSMLYLMIMLKEKLLEKGKLGDPSLSFLIDVLLVDDFTAILIRNSKYVIKTYVSN